MLENEHLKGKAFRRDIYKNVGGVIEEYTVFYMESKNTYSSIVSREIIQPHEYSETNKIPVWLLIETSSFFRKNGNVN